jgi:hypothetical protein
MHIFADGFSRISLANNNLRITLTQNGPDNQPMDAGTLIIPANMATGFVNSLSKRLKTAGRTGQSQGSGIPGEKE